MGFFSDLDDQPTESTPVKKGYFPDLEEEPSRTRSVLSALPKGLIKGAKSLSKLSDPFATLSPERPTIESEAIEKVLPTQEGHFPEEFLQTVGEIAPSFALGPEGIGVKAAQIGGGALSKNILKKAGAPEWLQEIGTVGGAVGPRALKGILSKKLVPTKSQQEVYDLLKGHGVSDKDIVPFIQSKRKVNALAKWTKGFVNRDKVAEQGKSVRDTIYNSIEQKGESLPGLSGPKKSTFEKVLDDKLKDIPYFFRKSIQVRS